MHITMPVHGRGVVMIEAASFIGTHERTLADLVDDGLDIPEDAALLVYRDRTRERSVRLIFPESARARADALVRMRRARRRDVSVTPLSEALV